MLCDRGYDRLIQPVYDEYTYRSRHLSENAFARLKSSRRIATRYEQTTTASASFVSLARVFFWLM